MRKVRRVLKMAAILTAGTFLIDLLVDGLSVATFIDWIEMMTYPTCHQQYHDPVNTVRSRTFDDRSINCQFACQTNGANQAHAVQHHSVTYK
jgi:hypothetical protein